MADNSSIEFGLDDIIDTTCEKHPRMVIKSFCTDHRDLVCDTCIISSHKLCTISSIADAVSNMKKSKGFDSTSKELGKLKTDYETLLQSRKNDKAAIVKRCDESLVEVYKLRDDVNRVLDALEVQIKNEVSAMKTSLATEIDSQCAIIGETIPQIENMIDALENCQKRFDSENMFMAMVKAERQFPDYKNIKAEIESQIKDIDIQFQPDPLFHELLKQVKSLGKVFVKRKTMESKKGMMSLVNATTTNCVKHDVGSKAVLGISCLSDGQIMLACGDDGVKLLDNEMKVKEHLAEPAFDAAMVTESEVIVTQGTKQRLKCIALRPSMKAGGVIKVGRNCWSVDVDGDEIFVVCHNNPEKGEVRVLNKEGALQRRLGFHGDNFLFIHPSSVKVSKRSHTLFVSDHVTNIVTCLDKQGNVKYQYFDAENSGPDGIHVDEEDNVLVCGKASNNLHIMTRDGKKVKVMEMHKDKVEKPTCVAYRPSDGRLLMGLDGADDAFVTFQSKTYSQTSLSEYLYGWWWR